MYFFKFKYLLLIAVSFAIANVAFLNDVSANNLELYKLPGETDGENNHFEITDSDFLNITVDSSELIKAQIESRPNTIIFLIEPISLIDSAQIIINGLAPLTTYYKYQDNYHSFTEFVSDINGRYSYVQDLLSSHFIYIQTHRSTYFIKDDSTGGSCALFGNWNIDTKTCVLNKNIYETVQIDSDNIILDGNGYSIIGSTGRWSGYGIILSDKTGVTIKNVNISNFNSGIGLYSAYNNIFINNNLSSNAANGIWMYNSGNNSFTNNITNNNNTYGIVLRNSNNNVLENNISSYNSYYGIVIGWGSTGNILSGNSMTDNWRNFYLAPHTFSYNDFDQIVDVTNLVNGKPIYYIKNVSNQIYDAPTNAGLFYCINCENIVIKDIAVSKNLFGVYLWNTKNSRIENVSSSENILGIASFGLGNNEIINSNIIDNEVGVSISDSIYANTIKNNSILNNWNAGIGFGHSDSGTVFNNTLSNNGIGVRLYAANNAIIYNNNFTNNQTQSSIEYGGGNVFNLLLPTGGNYWNNFDSAAEGCNDSNSDKVCDSSYVFQGGQDNYPWAIQNGWSIPIISNISQLKSDTETTIDENSITTESAVVFKANVLDLVSADQVKLQVELKEYSQPFDELDILESGFVSSGNQVSITRYGLINGKYHWRVRAIDDEGNTSDWQEFGAVGNADFEVKLVPLYTQVSSSHPSNILTVQWAGLEYANGFTEVYDCGSTIADCGCAISSMVMLGRYYDINVAIDNSDVNPGNINYWLNGNNGYSNGNLTWAKGVEYLGIDDGGIKKSKLVFDHYNTTDNNLIDSYVDSAKPAIAFTNTFGHYFVVDGKLKSGPGVNDYTYTIKDPYWYNTQRLNQTADTINYIQGYNNYFQKANLFSYLETPQQISASIYVYLASPAELLIIDPIGRRLGKDPISGIVYNEIPNSIYTYDEAIASSELPINSNSAHKTKVIYISSGDVGDYDVKVIGTGTGSYTISTLIYDNQGNSHTKVLIGNTQPNLITDYNLNFTPDVPTDIDFQLADTTPPVISHTQLNNQYLLNSAPVNFEFSASDSESGVSSISAKLDGVSMASGLPISFSQIGNHNIEITAQDFAGNILTETLNFEVIYDFSGFLSPIKIDGTGIYRLGRTLPIKFQLTDATNQYVYSVVSQLYIAKMQDGIVGTDEIALSTSNADSGNLFRYDDANNQYIYNLSTDSLSIGSWQLKAILDDGRNYTVVISIR